MQTTSPRESSTLCSPRLAPRTLHGVFWGLTSCLLLSIASCDGGEAHAREQEWKEHPLSMIWISLDTLRAANLGTYGYERDTSPFLDELAQRGSYFEWVVSPQNSTLPSHVTMFTGYHPAVHGVMHSSSINPGICINDDVTTLPEVLADAGFATGGWTDGGKMSSTHGFGQGFELYDDAPTFLPTRLESVLESIDSVDEGRPFFFFLQTYQVHGPYPAPTPYDSLFVTEGERTEAQEKLDLYDGCIRFVDDQLREFVTELERRGVLDRTILIITGDHGEGFAEYGFDKIGHGSAGLHQNITRVPWIMLHPDERFRGVHHDTLAGLIDFPNTVLPLLGFETVLPGGGVDLHGPESATPRAYLSANNAGSSLYAGEYHLLESREKGVTSVEIYNVASDSREERPLDDPETLGQLEEQLRVLSSEYEAQAAAIGEGLRDTRPVDEQKKERLFQELRTLGYVE